MLQAFTCVCNSHFSVDAGVENMTPFAMIQDLSNRAAQRNDRVASFFVNPKDQEIMKCVTVIETFSPTWSLNTTFLNFHSMHMTYARECLYNDNPGLQGWRLQNFRQTICMVTRFLMCPCNNVSYFHYYVSFLFIIAFLLSDDVPESMPGSEEFLPIGM